MTGKNARRAKNFFVGALIGLGLVVAMFMMPPAAPEWVWAPTFFVSWLLDGVDVVLLRFCDIFKQDLCAGLGLDNGPLAWIEWATLLLSPSLVYGMLCMGIGELAHHVRVKRKPTSNDKS